MAALAQNNRLRNGHAILKSRNQLDVFEWHSFSSNNSSDYRLIARFETKARARVIKAELARFFATHARQRDAADVDEPTRAALRLGKKYEHDWKGDLAWGDEALTLSLPSLTLADDTVVIYHGYCGGLGNDLVKVLKNAGAILPETRAKTGVPVLLVEFRLPRGVRGESVTHDLERHFAQRHEHEHLCDWHSADLAWGQGEGRSDQVSYVTADERCTFTYPLHPDYITNLRAYLRKQRVTELRISLATTSDVQRCRKADRAATRATVRKRKASAKKAGLDPRGLRVAFTGQLATMTLSEAKARIEIRGGKIAKTITGGLNVLVVGDDESPLFGLSAPGEKQRKAETLNAAGASIRIVSETALAALRPKQAGSKREARSRTKTRSISSKKPDVTLVHKGRREYLYSFAVSGDHLVAVGGSDANLVYRSRDGRKFTSVKVPADSPQGSGGLLRVAASGDFVWVVGNRCAWRSENRGRSFSQTQGTLGYPSAAAIDNEGRVMIAHLSGGVVQSRSQKRWSEIPTFKKTSAVMAITKTPFGTVFATDDGSLFVGAKRRITRLELRPGPGLRSVAATPSGALIAVGEGGRFVRSDDGGESFTDERLEVTGLLGSGDATLHGVASLPDGRVITAGEGGQIFCSYDDGRSFSVIATKKRQRIFWDVISFRDAVFLCGLHEGIVRVGP